MLAFFLEPEDAHLFKGGLIMLPIDFYKIESLLTNEEQMIQQSAAKFVDREILPIIGEHFEKGIPLDISKKLGENGFFGAFRFNPWRHCDKSGGVWSFNAGIGARR